MASHADTQITIDIKLGMFRALFVSAWAEQGEEAGESFSGMELMDIAPIVADTASLHAARTLAFDMERVNGGRPLAELFASYPGTLYDDPGKWGHYAAMQAMGHGVGLWEYGIKTGPGALAMPRIEFGGYSLDTDYFALETDETDGPTAGQTIFGYADDDGWSDGRIA